MNGREEVPMKVWSARQDGLELVFEPALNKGAQMSHHDNTFQSAIAIVRRLIEPEGKRLLGEHTDLKSFMAERHGGDVSSQALTNTSPSCLPLRSESAMDDSRSPEKPTAVSAQSSTTRSSAKQDPHCRDGQERASSAADEDTGMNAEKVRIYDVFQDKNKCSKICKMKGDNAQKWLDFLHTILGYPRIRRHIRSTIFEVMLRLSTKSGLCPKCLTINNVKKLGTEPLAGGGFGDVWKGEIEDQTVCLKLARVFTHSDIQKVVKEYMQEALVWQQLDHPNLLPFFGMYRLSEGGRVCLVSPWMEQGNLPAFLRSTKEEVNHISLAFDVVSGLDHLHDLKIVHSDLKGLNVLITPELRACISDFGLSHLADSHALKLSTPHFTNRTPGTARWLAPELLNPGEGKSGASTQKSDMYAYGCVCYEIFTGGYVPLYEKSNSAVHSAITKGELPSRTKGLEREQYDKIWTFMTSCWSSDPSCRPSAAKALKAISDVAASSGAGVIESVSDWSSLELDLRIRRNVEETAPDFGLLTQI
ncbi:Rho guanine nucleotide exchange factor [Marasmius tenuissimus]|uniref:Rho guanine nucleotide exchange factor n=1 Tax=Marasmius tenuissimus TaxID=585030 RepID=A0ABR2Z6I7_9AGAR